jgi:hypothetical protein
MIASAELTESKNLSTGLVTFKPFVGGSILDAVIAVLTNDGKLPNLDFLSVVQGYCMAKEFNINVNHGFNLTLAAEEWKAWCAARFHAMPRHATPCHTTPHHSASRAALYCTPVHRTLPAACLVTSNLLRTQGYQLRHTQERPNRQHRQNLHRRKEGSPR